MAVRVLESDLDNYRRQVQAIRKEIRKKVKEKDPALSFLNAGELLYRYPKDAKLYPVTTIILSNAENWDGPRCLKDMFQLTGIPDKFLSYIADYKLNFVEIPKLLSEDTERFQTDIREVFDVIRCFRSKEQMKDLFDQRGKEYESVDLDAYDLIKEYVNLENYGIQLQSDKGGDVDMRTGLDDWADEIREEGIKAMIEENVEENRPIEKIKEKIIRFFPQFSDKVDELIKLYVPKDYSPISNS